MGLFVGFNLVFFVVFDFGDCVVLIVFGYLVYWNILKVFGLVFVEIDVDESIWWSLMFVYLEVV